MCVCVCVCVRACVRVRVTVNLYNQVTCIKSRLAIDVLPEKFR